MVKPIWAKKRSDIKLHRGVHLCTLFGSTCSLVSNGGGKSSSTRKGLIKPLYDVHVYTLIGGRCELVNHGGGNSSWRVKSLKQNPRVGCGPNVSFYVPLEILQLSLKVEAQLTINKLTHRYLIRVCTKEMYVCMYVCMYVHMYVCMYVCAKCIFNHLMTKAMKANLTKIFRYFQA